MNLFNAADRWFRRPLTCRAVNEFLAEYCDGSLDPRVRRRFEAHVGRCPNCAAYLDQYRTTMELVQDDTLPEPPEELVALTLDFLRRRLDEGTTGDGREG